MKVQNNWKLAVNVNLIAIWMNCFNIAVTSKIAWLDYAWLNTCSQQIVLKEKKHVSLICWTLHVKEVTHAKKKVCAFSEAPRGLPFCQPHQK